MTATRSRSDQRGMTLIEMMLVIGLSFVVILGAGAVYRGVDHSYKQGAQKVSGRRSATYLSTVISRRIRVASDFRVYRTATPFSDVDTGDALALFDATGTEMYRFEWDSGHATLADSSGNRLSPSDMATVRFRKDPAQPGVVLFSYRTLDDNGEPVDVESAVALRN